MLQKAIQNFALRSMRPLKRMISGTSKSAYDWLTGAQDIRWSRVVLRERCQKLLETLDVGRLSVLEISGNSWEVMPFAKYKSLSYPDFDVCNATLPETFDLIIAEQVFEHLLWPYRAGRNVHKMLRDGGHFLISTPFLVRVHEYPVDCSRWTEVGLKYFLAECGFALENTQTDSWGNRACVKANFAGWIRYRRRLHSLTNEPDVPYHVWALTRK